MGRIIILCATAAALVACSGGTPDRKRSAEKPDIPQPSGPPVPDQEPREASAPNVEAEMAWESIASGEGTALRFMESGGNLGMSIACLSGPARLVVNVPAFRPVMSEDRFALGLGAESVTLVANPYEQEARPGVTGEGPIPDNLAALLDEAANVRALYGAQRTGPYPAPGPELKKLLLDACRDNAV